MSLISLPRIINIDFNKCRLVLACSSTASKIQNANIASKVIRDPNIKKPAPWPYMTKKYNYWKALLYEGTLKRFDENTKIIVVEGNIGAGKSKLAKELADAFDMVYYPEPTMDDFYINKYGYDIREIDPLVPPTFKSIDLKTFYANPNHLNVAKFQTRMYILRLIQYIDALCHLFNTGQGVVLERCVFSDFIFMEAMFAYGCFRKEVRDVYRTIVDSTADELLKPHLIVYLDISPEVALQRIKEKNDPIEVNSKILNKDYLETIEHYYKQVYLKKMENHSELLIYDWSNYGDVEVVVEDIERIDFNKYTYYDTQLKDWRFFNDWEANRARYKYTREKDVILQYAHVFKPRVMEMYHPAEEVHEYRKVIFQVPGEKYAQGFNPLAGDNVLFKLKHIGYKYEEELKRMH